MIRRQRLAPVVVVALFVVAVCAVSLAHAQPGEPDTCTAAKIGFESAPTVSADLAAPLSAHAVLEAPRCVLTGTSAESPAGSSHQILAGPLVPRAPPSA